MNTTPENEDARVQQAEQASIDQPDDVKASADVHEADERSRREAGFHEDVAPEEAVRE